MNIAFLLTPKNEVVTLENTMTLRQALAKMEHHKYMAIPVLDKHGKYHYTISEGDLLWFIKNSLKLDIRDAEQIHISNIKRSRDIQAVPIDADFEKVVEMTGTQNFVPVVDDAGIFIGIVTRSDMMRYQLQMLRSPEFLEKKKDLLMAYM